MAFLKATSIFLSLFLMISAGLSVHIEEIKDSAPSGPSGEADKVEYDQVPEQSLNEDTVNSEQINDSDPSTEAGNVEYDQAQEQFPSEDIVDSGFLFEFEEIQIPTETTIEAVLEELANQPEIEEFSKQMIPEIKELLDTMIGEFGGEGEGVIAFVQEVLEGPCSTVSSEETMENDAEMVENTVPVVEVDMEEVEKGVRLFMEIFSSLLESTTPTEKLESATPTEKEVDNEISPSTALPVNA